MAGLLYQTRIPRELIATLKKISPPVAAANKSDIESLFSVGDIFKVRVESINDNKVDLSALPFKSAADNDDDFEVIEDEDEAKEDKKGGRRNDRDDIIAEDSATDDESSAFNPLNTLVWWRGAPFENALATLQVDQPKDEELEILTESSSIVEGTWRRLFELDMREDAADFSSKIAEAEAKELEEEIGELNGLDDDLGDFGLGSKFYGGSIGITLSSLSLPEEWKSQLEFFKELETSEKQKNSSLRGGKKFEQVEFEGVVKEIESDLEKSASRVKRDDVVEASVPEAVAVSEPVTATAEVAETASVVSEEPVDAPPATE